MAADSFVIVEEIAATIENGFVPVDVDALRMMRRMIIDSVAIKK